MLHPAFSSGILPDMSHPDNALPVDRRVGRARRAPRKTHTCRTHIPEPEERLAAAIVKQAVDDWRGAMEALRYFPDSPLALDILKDTETFFLSPWFGLLIDRDGSDFLARLKADFNAQPLPELYLRMMKEFPDLFMPDKTRKRMPPLQPYEMPGRSRRRKRKTPGAKP